MINRKNFRAKKGSDIVCLNFLNQKIINTPADFTFCFGTLPVTGILNTKYEVLSDLFNSSSSFLLQG
jgi:hypothetical protein